jgi:hypothetical protein
MTQSRTALPALRLGLALLASACAPDFDPQWEVKEPRLFTAKIVIEDDDEGRTRPRPGDRFSIHYYLMSPGRPQASYGADAALCAGASLTDGTLACIDEVPLDTVMLAPYEGNDELVLTGLVVPELPEGLPPPFDELTEISMFGAICPDGTVERVPGTSIAKDPVPHLFQCSDNDGAEFPALLPFSMSIKLDLGGVGQLNHHPQFACDDTDASSACVNGVEHELEDDATITTPGAIVLAYPEEEADGAERERVWEAWDPAMELPWDDCASAPDTLPKLHAETKDYKIYVRLDPADRETYEREIRANEGTEIEETREEIVISHAITTKGGKVDSYSSVVRNDAPEEEAEIEVEYTPPRQSDEGDEHIADSGRLVRFYFALRDQRGGVDFTTRELCVLPPKD